LILEDFLETSFIFRGKLEIGGEFLETTPLQLFGCLLP